MNKKILYIMLCLAGFIWKSNVLIAEEKAVPTTAPTVTTPSPKPATSTEETSATTTETPTKEAPSTETPAQTTTTEKPEDVKPPYTPTPFVQNYFLDRLYMGFNLGLSLVLDSDIKASQGYGAIVFDYVVGDMIKQTHPLLTRSYGSFEYSAVSVQLVHSGAFLRASQSNYTVLMGTSTPLSYFAAGEPWRESLLLNVAAGIGVISYNSLDYQQEGNLMFNSNRIDMGFIMKLRASIDYKVWGPWMVTLNGATTAGSTFVSTFGMGVRSGF